MAASDDAQDAPVLEGVRVIDLSTGVSGPYCTRLLADYGASVTRIEGPGGDPLRDTPPFLEAADGSRESLFFLYLNHAKPSLALDLMSDEGCEQLLELVRDADVVVESFTPGTLDEWGLGWERLHDANPRLILTSITGFGQTGPYRDFLATDIVVTALGGAALVHGHPLREPLIHGNPQAEYRGGVVAASATVAALLNCDDEGEHVDISLMEMVASALRETIADYTYMGAVRRRSDRAAGGAGKVTPCADGYVIPSGLGTQFQDFARFMEAPELADDKFATGEGREEHREELSRLLSERLKTWRMADFFEGTQLWGMNGGIVMTPAQALECEQHGARGFFREIESRDGRLLTAPRGPFVL